MKKRGDYVKSLIDQLAQLHFTTCHTSAIVSQELTARKVNFTHEREATRRIGKLKVELDKACNVIDELVKSTSLLENLFS